jgi:hypothetical protein
MGIIVDGVLRGMLPISSTDEVSYQIERKMFLNVNQFIGIPIRAVNQMLSELPFRGGVESKYLYTDNRSKDISVDELVAAVAERKYGLFDEDTMFLMIFGYSVVGAHQVVGWEDKPRENGDYHCVIMFHKHGLFYCPWLGQVLGSAYGAVKIEFLAHAMNDIKVLVCKKGRIGLKGH